MGRAAKPAGGGSGSLLGAAPESGRSSDATLECSAAPLSSGACSPRTVPFVRDME